MFQNGKVCMFHKVSSCAFCALLKEIQMPSFLPFLFIHLPLELPSKPCLSISANWILWNLVADYPLKTQVPCTWMYRLTENVGADFFWLLSGLIQATTAIVEKTVRAFYSTIAVVASSPLFNSCNRTCEAPSYRTKVCCSYHIKYPGEYGG